ncbi:hypothetical protein HRI_000942800 [Hibiscus trionum]|uniref:AT hook motif-containing protein n=1 Tax=Hibiscus trionum TaxID=183268 RepID=A0A9W7H875_HIBTR|nr:hypothetical protein HRI_000942800 [Hibiscus trionum]
MSCQNQGASLFSSADPPAKLKRGRPCKDESVQGGNTPATPESDNVKRNKQGVRIGDPASDDMLGQMVSGFVEGSFDAGYLLNVKVGDTNVHLRGVVFLPGLFAPVTGANDVAPHAKMYKRNDIPIPFVNNQGHLHVASPPSGKSEKPIKQKNGASNLSDQGLHTGLEPGASVASNLPISESVLSLGQKVMQKQIFDSGLHNEKAVGQHPSLQRFEGPNVNVEAPKASEPVSAKIATSLSATETINLKPQTEHQALRSDLKQQEPVHDDVKSLGVDNNETPGIAESEPKSMACYTRTNMFDKQASPRQDIDISQDTHFQLAQMIMNGANSSRVDGLSATDITTTATTLFSASLTSLPVMIFGVETIPLQPESAAEESVTPTMVVPE